MHKEAAVIEEQAKASKVSDYNLLNIEILFFALFNFTCLFDSLVERHKCMRKVCPLKVS